MCLGKKYNCGKNDFSRYNLMVECFTSPPGEYFAPEWQMVVDMINRYLAVVNSSINFIIYCVAGKQFRSVLSSMLKIRRGTSLSMMAEVNTSLAAQGALAATFKLLNFNFVYLQPLTPNILTPAIPKLKKDISRNLR